MTADQAIRLAVVIPAYKPAEGFTGLVRTLAEKGLPAIVIVNDGSGPEYDAIFAEAVSLPGVHLLRHAVNLGKGSALKTAFNYVLCAFPNLAGVVTADADGQHDPADIERVAATLLKQPDNLVLGARTFGEDVPLRSRIGNIATSAIMHALLGRKVADTQTGLRGIPAALLPQLLRVESTGYEFELEMLLAAHRLSMGIAEVPIKTIYEPGNRSSHFNPVIDSMKIYFVLLRFSSVSLMSALLDNLIFSIVWSRSGNLLLSQTVGRILAVAFNYTMVRNSVFYTHQRHKQVLPKYLSLVVVSATASYYGIQFVRAGLGIGAIPAKLLVETLLFFMNFAIQRMFIFKPHGEGEPSMPEQPDQPEQPAPRIGALALVAALFAILVGCELYGFSSVRLFGQTIWLPVGETRFTRYLGVYLAIAVPLLVMVPWTFTGLIVALIAALTAISIGVQPLTTVAFVLLSACALGSMLLGRRKDETAEDHFLSTLLGLGVYLFLMTFVARVPVNYPAVWAGVLALPLIVDWRRTAKRIAYWAGLVRHAELRSGWARFGFAVLVFGLIAQWFAAVMPEISADGLAMHLAIPMNIAANHAMTFEPARFLWAVMPMGCDWLYSIAYLLGGEYAARLLNYAMLLVIVGLIYGAARRWVSPAAAWLLAGSFAVTPLVHLVTGNLFVENFIAALVLGLMVALWQFGNTGERRFLFLFAALAGTAIASKLGCIAFVVFALPFAVAEIISRSKARRVAACAIVLLLIAAVAAPPYVIAWLKTGNPVFPFQNQKFPSPLLDRTADVTDLRFRLPVNLGTIYTLTFHTGDIYEGQNGSFGFQYLLIAPIAFAGAWFLKRKRIALSYAVVAWGAAFVILRTQPNARYLYAAMPLVLVSFAAVLGWLAESGRWLYRALLSCLFVCTALNAWFLPTSSYYHKDFCLRLPFSRAERNRYVGTGAPVRDVIAWYNSHHPNSAVLVASGNEIAGLGGDIYENHWHQWGTQDQLRRSATVDEAFRLLWSWKVGYIIAEKPQLGEPLDPPSLRNLMVECTLPEYERGRMYLARLLPDCAARGAVLAAPAIFVPPGFYDDFDPAMIYRNGWKHDEIFPQADDHTVSYSDIPGAEASMGFEGTAVTYVYTKAFNRGIAEILIDGTVRGTVDLYSPEVHWQQRRRFGGLAPGRHTIILRVTGKADPKSTGRYVDLDSFFVE